MDYLSWDQPDPRWSLGLTWLATKIHPELFSEVNMGAEIPAFYRDFYELNDNVIEQSILPLVTGDL